MKKIAIAMGLLLLAANGSAFAQSGGTVGAGSGAAGGSSAGGTSSSVLPAPVGHRQPRLADVPRQDSVAAWESQQREANEELDRKLVICKGC